MKNFLLPSLGLIFTLNAYGFDEALEVPAGQSMSRNLGGGKGQSVQAPQELTGVTIEEHLGKNLNLDLTFKDHLGKILTLRDILAQGIPLLLTLNYFRCTTLCSIQLDNIARLLGEINIKSGKDYKMVTVSFDPSDDHTLATTKHDEYVQKTGSKDIEWLFLTGSEESVKGLTDSLGFFYKYLKESNEFAHAAAAFAISPSGKISRYLYGISYSPLDVKFALMEASENKIGSTTDRILLNCFHYNPGTGKYEAFAVGLLRYAAAVTVTCVAMFLLYLFWRDKQKSRVGALK
jgi:protein SCO1